MRQFVQLDENGAPKTWPIAATSMRAYAPDGTGFPDDCSGCDLSEFGFETLEQVAQPVFDPETQTVREATPVKVDGSWLQAWEVVKLSAADIAARTNAARLFLTCTPRQMRLALIELKMLDKVNAAVAAADQKTQIEWEYSAVYERRHEKWDAMGAALGLKPAAIDDVFALARAKE